MACKTMNKDTEKYLKSNPFTKNSFKEILADLGKAFKTYVGTDSIAYSTVKANIGMQWLQKGENPVYKKAWKLATGLRDMANMLTREDKNGNRFDAEINAMRDLSPADKAEFSRVSVEIEKQLFESNDFSGDNVTAVIDDVLSRTSSDVRDAYSGIRKVLDLRFLDTMKTLENINMLNKKSGSKNVRYTPEQQKSIDDINAEYSKYRTTDGRFKKNTPEEIKTDYAKKIGAVRSETEELGKILADDYSRILSGGRIEDSLLIDIYRQLGYKSGYMPHKRRGKYFAIVRNESGETIYREHFDTFRESKDIPMKKRDISEKLGVSEDDIETGINLDYEPDVHDIRAVRSVLENPQFKSKIDIDDHTISMVVRELAEMQKQGFGKHFRRRTAQNYIEGFDSDMVQSVNDYIYGSANALAKVEFRQKQVDLVAEISPADGSVTTEQKFIKRYLEEQFRASTSADMAVQKVSSIGYYLNFAVRPAYGVMNLAGHYVNLASQRLHSKSSIIESQKVMMDMFKTYYSLEKGKRFRAMIENYKDHKEFKAIQYVLDRAMATGRLDENFLEDFDSKRAEMSAISKVASWIPVKSEKLTRLSAFITGAIDAKKSNPNMSMDEIFDYASELDYMVNYARGRANRSSFEMGGGVASSLARIGTMYTSYTRNQIAMLGFMMKDKNYAGLGTFSAITLVAGGAMASPATGSIIKLLEQLFGADWEDELKASDDILAQVIGGGILYPAGADISSQMTASLPFLSEPYILSVFKNSHMAKYAHQKDYLRAVESGFLTPVQVKNVLKAIRLHSEGDKTSNGRLIVDENGDPIKVDEYGAILYSVFGIRPAQYSKSKAKQYLSQKMTQLYSDKKREVRARYLNADDGDASEIDALNLEIDVLNEGLGLDISQADTDVDDTYTVNMADVDNAVLWRWEWFGE